MKSRNKRILSIGMMIACGFCIQLSASVALDLILKCFPDVMSEYESVVDSLVSYNIKSIVFVALIAPVVEEIVFRIAMIRLGLCLMPFWIVNIIQAVLFGIYHGNIVQGIYAFLLGLLLGYVFYDSKTLYMSIVLHMGINVFGLIFEFLPLEMGAEGTAILYIAAAAAAALGIVILIKCHKLWSGEMTPEITG